MENKFLKKFDLVKSKFNKKLKDDLFKEEIEAFKKYKIIDENNMFNYIYIHNIYKNLIEKPLQYKINIISKSKEQIINFLNILFNEHDLNAIVNNKIILIYETYINFNDNKNNNLYNLYSNNKEERLLLLENKTIKEIENYLNKEENKKIYEIKNDNNNDIKDNNSDNNNIIVINEFNDNNNNFNKFLITNNNYIFDSYPSVKFIIYYDENYENNIINLVKNNNEKDYLKKNKDLISIEKDILNKYFNNKNTLYLNDQIYYRSTLLLSIINVFLYNNEEWDTIKESMIDKILFQEIKEYKNIIINNIICDFNNKYLYFSDKDKEKELFCSSSFEDDEKNYDLIENVYKQIYTHFKNEMHFIKTSLLNYNSLINDHMKLTYNENDSLKNDENVGNYLKISIMALINSEEEEYLINKKNIYENFINKSKSEMIQNLENIKKEIDEKYIIRNNTFDYLKDEIAKFMTEYEKQIYDFIKDIDNLNINIFNNFKKILNEQGIYSLNFDELIKIFAVQRITTQDPIKDLMENQRNSLVQILTGFGISGVIGGAASFVAGRAASIIGADAAAGTLGGPIGIGVGIFFGVGTLIGQAGLHYKKNRELINEVFNSMNNNIMDTINNVEKSIQQEMDKMNDSMTKDIKEIKGFINILIDKAIKLSA